MARRHHHRKVRRPPDPVAQDEDSLFSDFADVDWGDHGMFTVGFITPGDDSEETDDSDDAEDFDDSYDDVADPGDKRPADPAGAA